MEISKTRKLAVTAVISAIATLLMFIETPLPLLPFFLKLDPSDIPAVVCAFGIGPVWGMAVQLIKNLIHMLSTRTMVAGEVANFLVGSAFVLPAGLIYRRIHTKKGALLGLLAGTAFMSATGIFTNLFITLPLYSRFMPIDKIVEKAAHTNHLINDKLSLILYGITPFNIVKGALISIITLFIYKPLSPLLHYSIKRKN